MSVLTPLEDQLKSLQDLAMTDPVVYAEMKHLLESDPQGAHMAFELLQPNHVPRNVMALSGESGASVDLEAMKLQRMMQKRAQMFELLGNVLEKYDGTAKNIIQSIGR